MNEHEKFLASLEDDASTDLDILEQPLTPADATTDEPNDSSNEGEPEGDEGSDENGGFGGLKPRNRRERRLMKKLQEERESSMFLAGKLEARSEASKALEEESDYLKAVERIYGMESPEAQLATDLLKKAIIGAREDAKRAALEEWRNERAKELEEVAKAERELDAIVDEIEDTYDVTLSDAQERSYFQLLQKMSPKDRNGNVVEYADPHAVWEVFQEKLSSNKRGDSRAKDLAARSMVNSGASKESNLQDDAITRTLVEAGII